MGGEGDEEEEEVIGGGGGLSDDDAVSMVRRGVCSSNRLKFSLSLSLSRCVRARATDRVVWFRFVSANKTGVRRRERVVFPVGRRRTR